MLDVGHSKSQVWDLKSLHHIFLKDQQQATNTFVDTPEFALPVSHIFTKLVELIS